MAMQAHIGEELVELFRDGKYNEVETILGTHPDLLDNRNYIMDYFLIVENHTHSEAEDVSNHLISVLNIIPLDLAVEAWLKLCSSSCSSHTFIKTSTFILEKFPLIEKDEKLMDIFIYTLPYKLENRITTGLTPTCYINEIIDEAVIVLKIYNLSERLKFYKFPKLMRSLVGNRLFKSDIDADALFTEAKWRVAFHPIIVYYDDGKFLPQVYAKPYLLERIIESLTLYLQDFAEERDKVHYPSVVTALLIISNNMTRSFSVDNLQLVDLLVFNVLPYIQDFTLKDERKRILALTESILSMTNDISRVLILKHLAERAVQVNKKMEGDCLILAWIVDNYKRSINVNCFREELPSFWPYLEKLMFEDIEAAAAYYSAVFNLAAAQALGKCNKPMMANVKKRILEPLQDQLRDYVRLQDIKKRQASSNITENLVISDAQHIDLVTYNLNYTLATVNAFLSS